MFLLFVFFLQLFFLLWHKFSTAFSQNCFAEQKLAPHSFIHQNLRVSVLVQPSVFQGPFFLLFSTSHSTSIFTLQKLECMIFACLNYGHSEFSRVGNFNGTIVFKNYSLAKKPRITHNKVHVTYSRYENTLNEVFKQGISGGIQVRMLGFPGDIGVRYSTRCSLMCFGCITNYSGGLRWTFCSSNVLSW